MTASSPSPEIVIAGAGPMADEHVHAALACGLDPRSVLIVGRGRERAEAVGARHRIRASWGGVEALDAAPPLAIVAVSEAEAPTAALALARRGARHILLEKPGGLSSAALRQLANALDGAALFVGYNRRFYPSVDRARSLIEDDGGPVGLAFDFTEIEELVRGEAARRSLSSELLGRWGAANSLHVIDLAFHLAGAPAEVAAMRAGALDWHPAGALFAGSGRTEAGALFVYLATWCGAGRWGVEVTTRKRRLVLRPLEELRQQPRGSFMVEPVDVAPEPNRVKPGLYGQLRAFLGTARSGSADPRLCTINEAIGRLELAERIFGYE